MALCDPDRRIDDCLGRKSMNFTVLDTEDITRQVKRTDLPSTIGKAFVSPNCALSYLVNVVRRLRFSKNFRAATMFKLGPKRMLNSNNHVGPLTQSYDIRDIVKPCFLVVKRPRFCGRPGSSLS